MRSFKAGQQETVVHGKQLPEKINHLSRWTAPGTSIPVAAYLVLRLRPQASSLIVLFFFFPCNFPWHGTWPPHPFPRLYHHPCHTIGTRTESHHDLTSPPSQCWCYLELSPFILDALINLSCFMDLASCLPSSVNPTYFMAEICLVFTPILAQCNFIHLFIHSLN